MIGRHPWVSHPHVRTGDELTIGERAADAVVAAFGSWGFVATQTVFMIAWMTLNVVGWSQHWDPYPWILLNLGLSTQAGYAASLILIAGRRTDQRTAERAQADLEADVESLAILREIRAHLIGNGT